MRKGRSLPHDRPPDFGWSGQPAYGAGLAPLAGVAGLPVPLLLPQPIALVTITPAISNIAMSFFTGEPSFPKTR